MPSTSKLPASHTYSWKLGFVYVFNLLVGAALLALPKAFADAGWLLGLSVLLVLAFMSYVTVTFTVEAMSMANALYRYKMEKKRTMTKQENVDKTKHEKEDADCVIENLHIDDVTITSGQQGVAYICSDRTVTIRDNEAIEKQIRMNMEREDVYEITTNFDLGEMSRMFFHKSGAFLYYVSLSLYLYGGLTIYAAAIAKSLTTVICDNPKCFDGNVFARANASALSCTRFPKIGVRHMYTISLASFTLLICPFAYFNISGTKILQIFTTAYRWIAMVTMIVLSFMKIAEKDSFTAPKPVVVSNLPQFFGVALYAFMCQHSIPAVLTPVSKNKKLHLLVVLDFVCVVLFYAVILLGAVFAFPAAEIQDLYTLNFTKPVYFKYILEMFPVLTLSANFPILAIVLRQNIKNLCLRKTDEDYGIFLRRLLFPTIVILPPITVAYFTYDVGLLVGYVGTYAGAILQYIVPTMLVYCGRRKMRTLFKVYDNQYTSPFKHQFWISMIVVWYVVSLGFVIYSKLHGKV